MPVTEYKQLTQDAGWFDFSIEGKILITGEKRKEFCNGLVSNDIINLPDNQGIYAAFLDRFGKIKSDCYIFCFENHLLLLLPFPQKQLILEKLKQDAPLMNVTIEDITMEFGLLSVQGKHALQGLQDMFNVQFTLQNLQATMLRISDVDVAVIKTHRGSLPSYDILVPRQRYKTIVDLLSMPKMSPDLYEILRLEAGIPLFSIDFDSATILTEIGESAISYDKGCYVGQEMIIKIKDRGKGVTAKKLVKLVGLDLGEKLFNDDKEVGWVTSKVYSPGLTKMIGLGYLRKGTDYENLLSNGRKVEVNPL